MMPLSPRQTIADVPTSVARVRATLAYNGHDITADLAPYLLGLSYTDCAGEQADELSLEMADLSDLWGGRWEPQETDTITASIICYDWDYPGQRLALPCGSYQIATCSQHTPGGGWTISTISTALTGGGRRERKYRAWENATLRAIAADIAASSGLTLVYEASISPTLERVEQKYQADFAFLRDLAGNEGLRLKVQPGRLILFDEATYEQRAPSFIITPQMPHTEMDWTFNIAEVYRSCKLKYHDAKKDGDGYGATFTPPNPFPVGDTLYISEQVDSQAAAERLVRVRLREKNRQAITASISMPFHPQIVGAVTGTVTGFGGRRDGRYLVDRVTHALGGSGSTTQIAVHKALEGY